MTKQFIRYFEKNSKFPSFQTCRHYDPHENCGGAAAAGERPHDRWRKKHFSCKTAEPLPIAGPEGTGL